MKENIIEGLASVTIESSFNPNSLSDGTKVALTIALVGIIAGSYAKTQDFSEGASRRARRAAWTGLAAQTASAAAFLAEMWDKLP